jgi:predicted cytidylate kinase
MIIALGGKAGSGKSTVAKLLAKKLNYRHYSMGDLQREIAKERNISIFKLGELEEKDPQIDKEVDNLQISLGNKEDNFVIDSRLGFHFIPKAKKIFLDANFEVRAIRILNDNARKEDNKNLEKAKENIKQREKSEILRYKKYYNLNPYDKKKYDIVIDTSDGKPKQIVKNILSSLNIN